MESPLLELYVVEKRADLEREAEHHRLIREAEKARAPRPGLIANLLHAVSIWMIRKGERLHERYHVRSKACSY